MGGEARSSGAVASVSALPAATPGPAASGTADLLCLLAGDAWLDGRGYAQVALIRGFLEPFVTGGLEQALGSVVERLAAVMGTERCSLFLWNEEGTHVVLAACGGPKGTPIETPPSTPVPAASLPAWVVEMERLGHGVVMAAPARIRGRRRADRTPAAPPVVADSSERGGEARHRGFGVSRQQTRSPLTPFPWEKHPVLGIPLSACGRSIGILFCDSVGHPVALNEDHARLSTILGAALGPAIGAARANRQDLPEAPVDLRNARLALNGSLDSDAVLQMVSEMALEMMGAQLCVALSFAEEGRLRVHSAAEWPHGAITAGIDLAGDNLAARAVRSGLPAWVEDGVRAPRLHPQPAEGMALRAGVAVPLWDGARVTGTVLAYHSHPRVYSAEELRVLGALAAHAGAALRNCLLYERQRTVSETVQRSLAPRLPAQIEGIEVGHLFQPKTDQVGGDHYDLIPLPGGRVGIVIGDVAGSGLAAAIHTNMARYMARAFTFETQSPGTVIRKLNDAICTEGHSEVFLTLFYGILEPSGRLHYANGAHPYPILRRAGRSVPLLLETTGTVVGIIPNQEYEEREVRLHSGDTLLLYTDGVTEASNHGELFGIERLQAAVQRWEGEHPQDLVDEVARQTREFAGGRIRDDLALLAIRRR